MENKNRFPFTKWYWQILLGILCAFLNVAFNSFSRTVNLHLFLDVVFTVVASCIGWLSGFICCFFYHVVILLFLKHPVVDMFWGICGFTVWILVRSVMLRFRQISFLELLLFSLILTLIISVEGALLSTLMINKFDFTEDKEVMAFLVAMMRQQVPLFLSSFLSRVPLNFLDKGISVFMGYGIFTLYCRLESETVFSLLFRSEDLK